MEEIARLNFKTSESRISDPASEDVSFVIVDLQCCIASDFTSDMRFMLSFDSRFLHATNEIHFRNRFSQSFNSNSLVEGFLTSVAKSGAIADCRTWAQKSNDDSTNWQSSSTDSCTLGQIVRTGHCSVGSGTSMERAILSMMWPGILKDRWALSFIQSWRALLKKIIPLGLNCFRMDL